MQLINSILGDLQRLLKCFNCRAIVAFLKIPFAPSTTVFFINLVLNLKDLKLLLTILTLKCPLPKICHTYPTMMKLGTVIPYLKKFQKYMNHMTNLLGSADISIFLPEIIKFCYIKKYRYRFHLDKQFLTLLTFLESFNKHGHNFDNVSKNDYPRPL